MTPTNLVQRVWNYCNLLRDDGLSYGDYLEQITYLLFLKMADEYSQPPFNRDTHIPEELNWRSLRNLTGSNLESHYIEVLQTLGRQPGMIGQIYFKAQNRIQNPAQLHRLVGLIDSETWVGLDVDVKGEIYEGLLEKFASDTKTGAGQYFTPRPLIQAMTECLRPEPMRTMADFASGTGGFFLAYYDYIANNYKMNKDEKDFLKFKTFTGNEIVPATARLCLMNLFLHNIGDLNSEPPIHITDSLASDGGKRFDYILMNPPFGKKSGITVSNEDGSQSTENLTYERQDFWVTTSNKQLNFVQHIRSQLKADGRAAVIVPDNVLFEGGAGETVRKKLLQTTDLHTILRLPTGIFYANGVKANIIFFDNKPASKDPWTKDVWVYDMRTNNHFTLKEKKLEYSDLEDFIESYNPDNRHQRSETARFKKFSYNDIVNRDKTNLDVFWLKDESLTSLDNLPEPSIIAAEIIENLEAALDSFRNVAEAISIKKPKTNGIFNIQQAISALLDEGFTKGEMVIAKVLYLTQEIYKVPIGVTFTRQNFGPYDAEVKRALTAGLSKKNRFFINAGTKSTPYYKLGQNGGSPLRYGLADETKVALKDLLPKLQNADSASIERLASVCKLIQDLQTIDEAEINKKMAEWKPGKFTEEQIQRSLAFIKTNGWDDILLGSS
jgi:type I restriction enzyme M protein